MLKSIVIMPNSKTKDVGALLAIARAEAKKKENRKVTVKALHFLPEVDAYVCVYEI